MATVQELSDALAHVNTYFHDTSAWMKGLSLEDMRVTKELLNSAKNQWNAPGVVPDTLIGALRNQHPDLFTKQGAMIFPQSPGTPPPPAPAPAPPNGQPGADVPPVPPGTPPPPGLTPPPANAPGNDGSTPGEQQTGEAADAAKKLEDSLKKVNTKVADADRTLAEAVLNAHSNTVAGKQKLESIQHAIADAVNRQPALDTQMGAREFSKFLLSKQKEMLDIVSSADLDDKSKTAILAGLGYLNGATAGDSSADGGKSGDKDKDNKSGENGGSTTGSSTTGGAGEAGAPAGTTGPRNDAATDPLASLLSDPSLLGADPGTGSNPLSNLASGLPSMMPQIPGLGGGGLGGLGGLPGLLGGGGGEPGSNSLSDALDKPNRHSEDPTLKSLLDPSNGLDPSHSGDPSGEKPDAPLDPTKHDEKPGEKPDNEKPTPGAPVPGPLAPPVPPGSGPTQVQLPNGQSVTAPNPQMANVTKLIAQGTPIADAFHQNGMSWPPPPGTPVHTPTDPSRITMGSVGQFADHQVYAISKDLVVINGQIKPIAAASGPGFLGWMAPPDVPTTPAAPPTTATTSAVTPATAPAPAPAATATAAATSAVGPLGQPSGSNLLTPLVKN